MKPKASLPDLYSAQVLSFALQGEDALPPVAIDPEQSLRFCERCLRLANKARAQHLVLLGLGSGSMASRLAARLPQGLALTVCSLSPAAAREAMPGLAETLESFSLAVDTSPWALLLLLERQGLTPENAVLALNPEAPEPERSSLQALQRLFTTSRRVTVVPPRSLPEMAAGAILHPDEPQLDAFFRQFPPWLTELNLVWDAVEVPAAPLPKGIPVRQVARRLHKDFAAQRNAMLGLCGSPWMLYLDADEELSASDWERARLLAGSGLAAGWHLPRHTAYPDSRSYRVGYGLWPDLQLRLFRLNAALRFERPIHERLTGLDGPQAVALHLPIRHLTHLRKQPDAIRRKLELFDTAGGTRHRLNRDYPHLPCGLLDAGGHEAGPLAALLLA